MSILMRMVLQKALNPTSIEFFTVNLKDHREEITTSSEIPIKNIKFMSLKKKKTLELHDLHRLKH